MAVLLALHARRLIAGTLGPAGYAGIALDQSGRHHRGALDADQGKAGVPRYRLRWKGESAP